MARFWDGALDWTLREVSDVVVDMADADDVVQTHLAERERQDLSGRFGGIAPPPTNGVAAASRSPPSA